MPAKDLPQTPVKRPLKIVPQAPRKQRLDIVRVAVPRNLGPVFAAVADGSS